MYVYFLFKGKERVACVCRVVFIRIESQGREKKKKGEGRVDEV